MSNVLTFLDIAWRSGFLDSKIYMESQKAPNSQFLISNYIKKPLSSKEYGIGIETET